MSSTITSLPKHAKEKKKKRKGPGSGGGLLLNSDSFEADEVGVTSTRGIIIVDTQEDSTRNFSDLKYRAGEPSPLVQVPTLDVKPVVKFS